MNDDRAKALSEDYRAMYGDDKELRQVAYLRLGFMAVLAITGLVAVVVASI